MSLRCQVRKIISTKHSTHHFLRAIHNFSSLSGFGLLRQVGYRRLSFGHFHTHLKKVPYETPFSASFYCSIQMLEKFFWFGLPLSELSLSDKWSPHLSVNDLSPNAYWFFCSCLLSFLLLQLVVFVRCKSLSTFNANRRFLAASANRVH